MNSLQVTSTHILKRAMANIGMTGALWSGSITYRLMKVEVYLPVGAYPLHGPLTTTLGVYGLDFQDFKGDESVVGSISEVTRIGYTYPRAQQKITLKSSSNVVSRVSVDVTGEPADTVFRVLYYAFIVMNVFDENPVDSMRSTLGAYEVVD